MERLFPSCYASTCTLLICLFVLQGCGGSRNSDKWKEIYEESVLYSDKGGDSVLEPLLRAAMLRQREFADKMAPFAESLKKASRSDDRKELLLVSKVVASGGTRSLSVTDEDFILTNLYDRLDPSMDEDLAASIFDALFVAEYHGDMEKIIDALEGEYPHSCLFNSLAILLNQEDKRSLKCHYCKILQDNSDEIVSGLAKIKWAKLGCKDTDND